MLIRRICEKEKSGEICHVITKVGLSLGLRVKQFLLLFSVLDSRERMSVEKHAFNT